MVTGFGDDDGQWIAFMVMKNYMFNFKYYVPFMILRIGSGAEGRNANLLQPANVL